MDFLQGLTDELVKLAGEEGDTMYGHGDGQEEKKKPSIARGAAVGAAANVGAAHAGGEVSRRLARKHMPPALMKETGEMLHGLGGEMKGIGGAHMRSLGKAMEGGLSAKGYHGHLAKGAPLALLAGGLAGAGVQKIRKMRQEHAEKQAGLLGHAKPGMIGRLAAKVPKKAVGAAALGGAAFGAGHHRGLKKGEGEAVQVGEQAYGAGARDMENALMSELGIG